MFPSVDLTFTLPSTRTRNLLATNGDVYVLASRSLTLASQKLTLTVQLTDTYEDILICDNLLVLVGQSICVYTMPIRKTSLPVHVGSKYYRNSDFKASAVISHLRQAGSRTNASKSKTNLDHIVCSRMHPLGPHLLVLSANGMLRYSLVTQHVQSHARSG